MANWQTELTRLGLTLPGVAAPLAAYVPAVRSGSMVYTSGQLPIVDGALTITGKVGDSDLASEATGEMWISTAEAVEGARICALNALAAVHDLVGLDAVARIVKVVGFVASAPGYTDQPLVINGASELLGEVFGAAGSHARSAVGVAELPKNAPVEVELIVELKHPLV